MVFCRNRTEDIFSKLSEKKCSPKRLQKMGEKGKRNFIDNISPLIGF
jgi:hypothetical protein